MATSARRSFGSIVARINGDDATSKRTIWSKLKASESPNHRLGTAVGNRALSARQAISRKARLYGQGRDRRLRPRGAFRRRTSDRGHWRIEARLQPRTDPAGG